MRRLALRTVCGRLTLGALLYLVGGLVLAAEGEFGWARSGSC